MVRQSSLRAVAARTFRLGLVSLIFAVAGAQAGRAESLRDWYVGMKRTAKDLRVAAHTGNQPAIGGARSYAYVYALTAGSWNTGEVAQLIANPCRDAANGLLAAAKAAESADAAGYAREIARYQGFEDVCFRAFTSAEGQNRPDRK